VKQSFLRAEQVEFIPKELDDGILYVSRRFRTASHRCCCGCGIKIVTPLRETEYKLTEVNGAVSLEPSIGNWNHPCQAHYWIRNNRVVWAAAMTPAQIAAGRMHDEAVKAAYFAKVAWPWWKKLWHRIQEWLFDKSN
jgi:hypothetical protein